MADPLPCRLIWGCDPGRQIEQAWITSLLDPAEQVVAWDRDLLPDQVPGRSQVLVESGLLHLERSPAPERLAALQQQRHVRLQLLSTRGPIGLIHLSDEEGIDGDGLYPLLPKGTVIWRNFSHPRLQHHGNVSVFPIGPRAELLKPSIEQRSHLRASQRSYPWAFMGTLWSSGSRTLAASLFLHALPQGFYFGGRRFGQGLPVEAYTEVLLQSSFALCPEGDRHLDTFRLHESLQAGCIPVVVDQRQMAIDLLGTQAPFPVFNSWPDALLWVRGLLAKSDALDATQVAIASWWQQRRHGLARAMRHTLIHESF